MVSMLFDICLNLTFFGHGEVSIVMTAVLFLIVPINLDFIFFNDLWQEMCTILNLFFKIMTHTVTYPFLQPLTDKEQFL